MEKKQKIKCLFITLFSIILIAVAIVGGYFLFRPSEETTETHTPTLPSRYFLAQTAIFNDEYSQNFNGIYKFDRVNMIYLNHLSAAGRQKIYDFYKVTDTLSLITKFTNSKRFETKTNNETLIIE